MQPCLATSNLSPRAVINRLNATHSTGPRTAAGKLRSSRNALRHGLTAVSPVLPTEDLAAYEAHHSAFLDEYQPATPTETQLVHELADTAWRMNRIPLLEARLLSGLDGLAIVEAHRLLQNLSVQSNRLSRQFHKTLDQLRAIQADRREREARDLKQAAALFELDKSKGIEYDPARDGFVFSRSEVETHSQRLMRHNEAHHFAYIRFYADPKFTRAAGM
jgi:hypothetical protein